MHRAGQFLSEASHGEILLIVEYYSVCQQCEGQDISAPENKHKSLLIAHVSYMKATTATVELNQASVSTAPPSLCSSPAS